MNKKYNTFLEFYPFYLKEHSNAVCRRLHFFGSFFVLLLSLYILFTQKWWLVPAVPIIGYGCAWVGHIFFEKNKPATFTYPFYSLMGDWVMFKDILIGKIKL